MKDIFDDLKSSIWKEDRLLEMRQFGNTNAFKIKERERFGIQPIGIKSFELFKGKRGKRFKHILYKIDNKTSLRTRIYDYVYFGDSKTRTSTVVEFYLPQWTFSTMMIRPKSNFSKMKDIFGKSSMLFEECLDFHKKYLIKSPLAQNLKYELNEEFLELFAEQGQLWAEADQSFLIFYIKNQIVPINNLLDHYEYLLDLLESLLHGHSSEEYV